ncbi:MAG: CBS domain-containing protein [Candidatus Cloacimonetes bacterium]|nr:CBS domain-containing protein [Candidatus Cloacimonadota bacterium]MDY0173392.1 CBS domain-containing protein [Candidatus Cloacimonadaceae bacterium]
MANARDIMTTEVVSVEPQTSLQDFSAILEKSGYSVLPVINPDNTLYGIISATDLVESDRPLHIPTVISIFDWVLYLESEKNFSEQVKKICAQTVGEICTREVITCTPETSDSEVAELMVKHKVHLIPVVEQDKLIGVVGRLDIIRNMGRPKRGADA